METRPRPGVSEHRYGIGDLSKEFDVSLRALRFYEQQGLLSPRRVGNRRIYSHGDRTRLKLILLGRRVGLSLVDIKEILDRYDAKDHNLDQLSFAIEKGEEQMRVLEQEREEIEDAIDLLEDALSDLRQALCDAKSRAARKRQGPSPLHA